MIDPLELLIESNQGNKASYSKLLHWLAGHATTQIRSRLRGYREFPKESVEDISQEILITFHQARETFDTDRPFLPWINAIIRFKTVDFIRKKDFKVMMSGIDLKVLDQEWQLSDEMDEINSENLLGLLESLPPETQAILKLAKVEGYTSKEIALKMHLSDSNVKVIIHRGLKELRKRASLFHNKG